ncbi:MAG: hypothetical protein ACR2OH_14465 [Microthrixaceae bacterium]
MPVEQRSGGSQAAAIAIGVVAVIFSVAAVWLLLGWFSGGDAPVQINLGDEDFDAGQVTRIAAQIEQEGPILYSDVSGRGQNRPIWVNHFNDDPDSGWYVFDAIAPGAPEGCFLAWNSQENLFDERRPDPDDPQALGKLCRNVTYSATGEGLEQAIWKVDSDDNLIITLRSEDEAEVSDTADSD